SVAKSQPIAEEEIKNNFSKSELFEAELDCDVDNFFLPKKVLNDFRRNVFEKIFEALTDVKKEKVNKIILKTPKNNKKFNNFQEILDKNENLIEKNIIYSPEQYNLEEIEKFINICKKQNRIPYLNLPNFALKEDVELLKSIIEKTTIGVVVNNPYALSFETEKIIGGGMNVYNSFTANYFNLQFISAEQGEYKMPYMTLRHCPMKEHLKATCVNCPFKDGFEYVMQNGRRFKLKRIKMSSCTFYLTD
ncbi:MAG: DUF3656 domain-containing protein, partial [Clostridia bacterium]|nr:DUF3656 domain-containing protein [Clostridia bacterium]